MSSLQVYNSIALVLSGIFALSAVVHLASPGFVRRAYTRWNFARGFHLITGIVELAAAAFLASPTTRIWGVVLAAAVLFSAVVTLLSNRQYAYTVPSIIMLIALAPASLAGPI
jgi:DoxX-like family